MGNIRTTQIKNVSEKLVKMFPDKFSKNFEENKRIVSELLHIKSKDVRNKIAGYITHIVEKKQISPPPVVKKKK
ncbi:MAG: 30S ribosomal protein S17e [Candidatus Aenigmatarchaeota archaeon]